MNDYIGLCFFHQKQRATLLGGVMKIVFQAFHWDCQCQALDLPHFLAEMNKMNGREYRRRILYFIQDNDYWVGLVLTVKDMRKFVTLVESKQELKLDVHELDENEKIADFNFFVVHTESGFGLYQHYHQSCSLNVFNYLAKHFYNEMRTAMFTAVKEKLETKGKKKRAIDKELKAYRGKFSPTIVERKGSFIERVKKLNDASAAELEFTQLDFSNNPLQAIQSYLKTMKYKMSFSKTTSGLDKIKSLASILSNGNIKKATVEGIDEHGNDVVYRLFNDFDRFQEYDYEDMVPSLNLDQTKVSQSILNNDIIVELKSVFESIAPALKL